MSMPDLRPSQEPAQYGVREVPPLSPRLTRRQVRDLLAVLLLITGIGGLLAVAFLTDWRLGVGVICAGLSAAGVALGLDRR